MFVSVWEPMIFFDFYSIRNKILYLFWRAHLQLLLQTVSSSLTNNTVSSIERQLFYVVLWNIKHLSWISFVANKFTWSPWPIEKHTRVYSILNKIIIAVIHRTKEMSFDVSLMNCKFDALLWAYLIQREKFSYVTFLQILKLFSSL
jgi:hypothetical protein